MIYGQKDWGSHGVFFCCFFFPALHHRSLRCCCCSSDRWKLQTQALKAWWRAIDALATCDSLAVRAQFPHRFSRGAALPLCWVLLIAISWNRHWLDSSLILLNIGFHCGPKKMDPRLWNRQTYTMPAHNHWAALISPNALLFKSAGIATSLNTGCRISCNRSSHFV